MSRGGLVKPVGELGGRGWQEHGRLRFGVQVPVRNPRPGYETRPKALKTWRFTSPDREAIAAIAEIYGGEVKAWNEPKANPQHQWEVITTSATVRVFLPPGGLTTWYELWSGAGCQRRCDGEQVEVLTTDPNDPLQIAPCICNATKKMLCKPKTRLAVILPEIRFGGVWRMETGSWNAAEELPAMEAMLATLQTYGVLEARLTLVEQSIQGGSKQFVMPRLEFDQSTLQILEGASTVRAIEQAAPQRALEAPRSVSTPPGGGSGAEDWVDSALGHAEAGPEEDLGRPFTEDDEIVDAELVDDEEAPHPEPTGTSDERMRKKMLAVLRQEATRLGLDPDEARHGAVRALTDGKETSSTKLSHDQVAKLLDTLADVTAGRRSMEFADGGRLRMPKVAD